MHTDTDGRPTDGRLLAAGGLRLVTTATDHAVGRLEADHAAVRPGGHGCAS
ncbi:hypothetical protein RYH80_10350 [Halobaculum sp. MBLA0147]|uniref:hypothetical protein n=1 Tax=Halobaculum sp. MBLA0147 TaxID=3079934 RepID=UPI003525F9B1